MIINSPIGKLFLEADSEALLRISFTSYSKDRSKDQDRLSATILKESAKQLTEYFAAKRTIFTVPYKLSGSPFQLKVWNALDRIPWGETRSYGDLAKDCQSPKAARAVGNANNVNPLPIILPCHRVIGSNGSLTGYAGGLNIKKYLLDLEQKNL